MRTSCPRIAQRAFTLVELAIVLVIVAFLVGGMLISFGAQRDISAANETQKQFNDIRDALIGFAAANGRLPCPASPSATGAEDPPGGGPCTTPRNGFLPAVTLGITPTDAQGYALDSWGNPIRYAVTTANSNAFTAGTGIKNAWSGTMSPDLQVCNTSAGMTGTTCATGKALTSSAVAVILSTGKNGGTIGGADEQANITAGKAFVSHSQTPAGSPQGEFDDLVTWLSPNILYNRMISAGKLP